MPRLTWVTEVPRRDISDPEAEEGSYLRDPGTSLNRLLRLILQAGSFPASYSRRPSAILSLIWAVGAGLADDICDHFCLMSGLVIVHGES
jgi:hypothetical protein